MSSEDGSLGSEDEVFGKPSHPSYFSDNIVASSAVKLYSTSTKMNSLISKHERRTMHLLDSRGAKYQLIYVDLDDYRQAEMEAVSGMATLPQLQINGRYFGDWTRLQDMEDSGELAQLLSQEGVELAQRAPVPSHVGHAASSRSSIGGAQTVSAKDGVLAASATSKFINLTWTEGSGLFLDAGTVDWLLTMDGEPVYCGRDYEYLVTSPGNGAHRFTVMPVDHEGMPLLDSPAGELSITAPPMRDGLLTAKTTSNFVDLRWHGGDHLLHDGEWMLTMNGNAVYVGTDDKYMVSKPPAGVHIFQLRLRSQDGCDITDNLSVRLGELTIVTNNFESPTLRKARDKKHSMQSVNSMVNRITDRRQSDPHSNHPCPPQDLSSDSSTSEPDDTVSPEPCIPPMTEELPTDQNLAGQLAFAKQLLNEKEKLNYRLQRKLEIQRADLLEIERILGISLPVSNASSHERCMLIIDRIMELRSDMQKAQEDGQVLLHLDRENEHLRTSHFELAQSRNAAVAEKDREIIALRAQLEQERLERSQLQSRCTELEAERAQVRVLQEENEKLTKQNQTLDHIRRTMDNSLDSMVRQVEVRSLENEACTNIIAKLQQEKDAMQTRIDLFEEAHVELMKQVEEATVSRNASNEAQAGTNLSGITRLLSGLVGRSADPDRDPAAA